jgi:signal transduction histidine kinase
MFDRFWRADASRSRNTGGSGLGLAIVTSLVERHHGTASAQPSFGGGLTVTITLPLVVRDIGAIDLGRRAVGGEAPGRSHRADSST